LIFDKDFGGIDAAAKQFDTVVNDATSHGFKTIIPVGPDRV